MEMIHEFRDPAIQGSADGDVIEDGLVLNILAEPDTARVRADGDAEFCGQKKHGHDFIDASESAGIDLTE